MSKNILIVDDSNIMRKMIVRNLRQAGLDIGEVYEAGDGQEGLKALEEHGDIEVILSDWNMPNMNGLDFVKALRGNGNNKPVVMITTEATEAKVTEVKEAGANGCIAKPFTPYSLEKELKQYF